jgi:hypothetical protein
VSLVRPTVERSILGLYIQALSFGLCLWDLQVLFYNLFTCAEGHGNPTNGIFGIAPPSVAEYLYSVNNNLLIPLMNAGNEEDNFGEGVMVIDCVTISLEKFLLFVILN